MVLQSPFHLLYFLSASALKIQILALGHQIHPEKSPQFSTDVKWEIMVLVTCIFPPSLIFSEANDTFDYAGKISRYFPFKAD